MLAFNELYEEYRKAGIAIHTITAEPGGEQMIREKMKAFGLEPELKYPVHSDPSWSLMTPLDPRNEIFVDLPNHPFLYNKGLFDEEYIMVQPALVIVDTQGKIVYWWSWKKLDAGAINDDGVLPNALSDENPTGNSHDVRWRPLPSDILRALTDGKEDFESIVVGNVGFPDGLDHVNPVTQISEERKIYRQQPWNTDLQPQHSVSSKNGVNEVVQSLHKSKL